MRGFELECGKCGDRIDAVPLAALCPSCARPLLVRYDLDALDGVALPETWGRRSRDQGMWRFREILPIGPAEQPVTLGEGATPLVSLPAGAAGLNGVAAYVKDEGRNPTGSFKDRGLSAAVTRAAHDGARSFVIPSAGNAGVSLATYASRAGLPSRIYLPADTPPAVLRRTRSAGAEVRYEEGLITDCGVRAREHAARTGAFDVSTLREPYRIEGKKTMMLEIAESLDWRPPEAIVYPTGGGTGLIGSWKALRELQDLQLIDSTTRLYAVQSEGCAPIVRAFERGHSEAEPWTDAQTSAFGLRVPGAIGDFLILRALRESGGGAVTVSDDEARAGADELGLCGVSASIEGGATLAGARKLLTRGDLVNGDRVVLFNTAHALVY